MIMRYQNAFLFLLAIVLIASLENPALALGTRRPAAPPGRKSLRELAADHGFPRPAPSNNTLTLKDNHNEAIFHGDSRRILFNNILVWMNGGTEMTRRDWTVTALDADTVLAPLLKPACVSLPGRNRTIVIDPGHGGEDTGAVVPGSLQEKDLVLDVAKRVAATTAMKDRPLLLTRDDDTQLSLAARSNLARKQDAAVFVSIHMNSAPNPAARGIETYVMPATGFPSTSGGESKTLPAPGNRHDAANSLLAYCIQKQLLEKTGAPDRGIRRARFDVIRDAPCPAILIECGFLSNTEERENLLSADYRQKLADGIAAGISNFLAGIKLADDRTD